MFAKTILGRFVLPKSHPSVLLPRRSFLSLVDTVGETQNPLLLDLKQIARAKNLCDENGFRTEKHWTFVISVNSMNTSVDEPPKLKTLNFQRVSNEGIDFVSRKKPNSILSEKPVSFLYTAGQYISGQTIIQWRADGICEKIDLGEVLAHIPEYSITEMVATDRARKENNTSAERQSLEANKSHFTEIVQQTRADLANSNISLQEVDESIQAWRFIPNQCEKLQGGPDHIMWDRFEFKKEEGSSGWKEPCQLMPH